MVAAAVDGRATANAAAPFAVATTLAVTGAVNDAAVATNRGGGGGGGVSALAFAAATAATGRRCRRRWQLPRGTSLRLGGWQGGWLLLRGGVVVVVGGCWRLGWRAAVAAAEIAVAAATAASAAAAVTAGMAMRRGRGRRRRSMLTALRQGGWSRRRAAVARSGVMALPAGRRTCGGRALAAARMLTYGSLGGAALASFLFPFLVPSPARHAVARFPRGRPTRRLGPPP